jgi:hypothetical protein
MMAESPQVGETFSSQVEVLSIVEKVDRRQNSVTHRVRIRFTSGPFKGLETSIKQPVSSKPKGVRKVAKQPASQGAPQGGAGGAQGEQGEDE